MIQVGNGTLDRFFARLSQKTIDAYVVYQLSNGTAEEKAHLNVPIAAVVTHAQQSGRSEWTATDLCAVIAAGIADFDGTITPAV